MILLPYQPSSLAYVDFILLSLTFSKFVKERSGTLIQSEVQFDGHQLRTEYTDLEQGRCCPLLAMLFIKL